MPEYRTPREVQAQTEHEAWIQSVLDQVVHDGASLKAAILLGEPADVVEHWIDILWDGLRGSLSDDHPDHDTMRREDRLHAIVLLLNQRMSDEADAILRGLRDGEPDV